uniref:peptidoglycan recognition protein 1-like n=1 Tax=Bombus vancouverensis nearcticus TaxID=2705178 RepID=UPI00143B7C14|nr:peptidoglycan recognition protein 1-like [Bombus vancouverensis nearcticus]
MKKSKVRASYYARIKRLNKINECYEIKTKNADDRSKKWLWGIGCAAILFLVSALPEIIILITNKYLARNSSTTTFVDFPQIPDSGLGDKVKNVRFIEQNEWGAQPPTTALTKMKLPVPYVIISHTATEICRTEAECAYHVRYIQTFHIESKQWSDIAYNFLVGGDGYVYVGRSWDFMGAHSFGFNNISIGISFIGTFNIVIPPTRQLYAAQRLIELGIENGKIAPDYKLLGHRQVFRTSSPGDTLYSAIQTWPHWSPSP